jgi:hypothetical protein
MNASTAFSTETVIATPAAERFGKRLLLVNGIVLGLVALCAGAADLVGHFFGMGPFSMYAGNYDSIAFVEAHGLALILASLFIAYRDWPSAGWHWIAAAVHLLLGGANLTFWTLFVQTGTVPMGIITTSMHLGFVALHGVAVIARAFAGRIK